MKKLRLITASFNNNNIELLINSSLSYKDCTLDIVYYNDANYKSRQNSLHPRLKGKIPKMMEWLKYPGYDYYIWIDSKFVLFDGFIQAMLNVEKESPELFLFKHSSRASIREELIYMQNRMSSGSEYLISRYFGEEMEEQVRTYLSDQDFKDDHLYAGGCFMYSSSLVANRDYNMMTDWLLHNTMYSIQDQLSLPYLIYKHQVKTHVYNYDLMNNAFMSYRYSF